MNNEKHQHKDTKIQRHREFLWRNHHRLWLIMLIAGLLILALPAYAQDDAAPRYEAADCPFQNNSAFGIECGYVTAPEDHWQPDDGRTVKLATAIIRSKNPNKPADPVVYLIGGPGGEAVAYAPLYTLQLAYLLAERDVVLFDQRGAGHSLSNVSCPLQNPLLLVGMDSRQPTFTTALRTIGGVADCEARLQAEGIDAGRYTVEQNAADIQSIREALGYEQINLYGASWGTRLGLVALRQGQTGIRSAIFDAVLPPQNNGLEYGAAGFDRAFRELEQTCANDTVCRVAYPNLRELYVSTYERLKTEPVTLDVGDHTFTLTASAYAGTVYEVLISAERIKGLPALIANIAQGDYEQVSSWYEAIADAVDQGQTLDVGAFLTMTCSDDGAHTTLEQLQADEATYPEAFRNANPFFGVGGYRTCQAWTPKAPDISKTPAVSDVPTLLLSGQFDPLLPPEWTAAAGQTLPNSYHYVFPGAGHLTAENSCSRGVMVSFLRDPSHAPNTDCLTSMGAPTFVLSIVVTRPIIQIVILLLTGAALVVMGQMIFALRHGGWQRITWRTSLKMMGWLPIVVTLGGLLLVATQGSDKLMPGSKLTFLQIVMPLALTIQAALVFASDDEPGLEMLLALPRPIHWLIIERLMVILVTQCGLAFVAAGIYLAIKPDTDAATLLLSWLPSAFFLSGISLYVSLRSRVMIFGALVGGFLWFAFALFGGFFLPGMAFSPPLNIIQPFMWVLHLYATPADFAAIGDFWLNRAFLFVAGLGLMTLGLREVRDEETVLMQASTRQQRRTQIRRAKDAAPKEKADKLKHDLSLTAIPVAVVPLRQIMGMAWCECRMHWRRRPMLVLTLTMILGALMLLLVGGQGVATGMPGMPDVNTLAEAERQIYYGDILMVMIAGLVLSLTLFVLPVIVADAVPLDRQGMGDLLDSLPITTTTYLLGKLLGLWLALFISAAISSVVIGVVWLLAYGAYHPGPYLDLWLVAGLPLMLLRSGLALGVGATQPTRRRAALAIIAVFIISLFATPNLRSSLTGSVAVTDTINAAPLIYYVSGGMAALAQVPPTLMPSGLNSPFVTNTLLVGGLHLLVALAVAWVWLRRKQA